MAITTQNIGYLQNGPVASGQQLAPSQLESLELSFLGTATFTGDGSTQTATINYIDGTNALNFTPRSVLCWRSGGTDTSVGLPYCKDGGNAGVSGTVQFSVAPANGLTQVIGFAILK
jgi:hypothetical protein